MREDLEAEDIAAMSAQELVPRQFMWITARLFDTDCLVSAGYWTDEGTYDFQVIDGNTREEVTRTYVGSGTLISVSAIPLVADLSIRKVTARLSPINEILAIQLRGYDLRNAPVEIHRGFLNPFTRELLAPAKPQFVGTCDAARIVTPEESETAEGYAELDLVSIARELTRASAEKRSHESQLRRDPTDDFFKDAEIAGSWEQFWGVAGGPLVPTVVGGNNKGSHNVALTRFGKL